MKGPEIKEVLKYGRAMSLPELRIKALKTGRDEYLFAVIVGKAVSGSSVERNRVKRIYREALRKTRPLTGLRLAVMPGRRSMKMKSTECEKLIERLFSMNRIGFEKISN